MLEASCGDDLIETSKVVSFELPESIIGDGNSELDIRVQLDSRTSIDFRKLTFRASNGTFIGAPEDNPKELSTTADFFQGQVFADVKWQVPSTPGMVIISVEPAVEDIGSYFLFKDSIRVDTSIVASLNLSASSFAVENNFKGEIAIEGNLKNFMGNGVSSGVKVKIQDYFDNNGEVAGGRYRSNMSSSNSKSLVSTIYSPGAVLPDQDILLIGVVLDNEGQETNIKDTVKVYVIDSNN